MNNHKVERIAKRESHAFGKDVYLLGKNQNGEFLWLEAPSWDCEWYWGFGYVETYTNNANPSWSRDITSHSHFSGLVGKLDKNHDYIHHINMNPEFESTTLTESESWQLAELMKRFYTLRETADMFHQGTAGVTSTNELKTKNEDFRIWINEVALPEIFKAVIKLLKPLDIDEY